MLYLNQTVVFWSTHQEYLGIGGGTGEPVKDPETFDELFYNLSVLENLGKAPAGL